MISWWSNSLGLTCLHNLVKHTTDRKIYVIQFGKQEQQKELFRYYMPKQVIELDYDYSRCTEEWYVREVLARETLKDEEGLWFIDHDCFMLKNCDNWLKEMDMRFSQSNICFSHPLRNYTQGVTQPAFWLCPARFPENMPGFSPIPTRINPVLSDAPFASTVSTPNLAMPEKDTLVAVGEYLQQLGMVLKFPLTTEEKNNELPVFPHHQHIGGLYVFTFKDIPSHCNEWLKYSVEQFNAFYATCPPQWRSVECPVLKSRLKEFTHIFEKRQS